MANDWVFNTNICILVVNIIYNPWQTFAKLKFHLFHERFVDNAQVTQWRGCYDGICEYRRTEATSNSPEFAKKVGKCSHVIKDLHTSTTPLRCLSNVLRQSKNIQRIPYELVKISGEFTHESATSRGE